MNTITLKLVGKDLSIMIVPTLLWWLCGFASIAVVVFGGSKVLNFASILFISGMAGAGIHSVMSTVMLERRDKTMAFIMSLPITISQYNTAKLIANLLIFSVVWVTLSVASYLIVVSDDTIPMGNIPFLVILFVGILLANIFILAISLITETMGGGIAAIVGANVGTQLYMWWVHGLDGIQKTINGSQAIWNGNVIMVLASQIAAIVILILFTYVLQARKKDYI